MATTPTPVTLNPLTPDFLGIYDALEADVVSASSGSWNDLAVSATGSNLLRYQASIGAFAQGSIARALQESYLDTARSPSGVYRAVRLQGARLLRTRPGQVTVTITRTDANLTPLVIPARTQWTIAGAPFYNPSPITLPVTGASVVMVLNRGTVQTFAFTSVGTPNQMYVLGTTNLWNVSDVDVWMTDSLGTVWSAIQTGLWREIGGSSTTFYESTLPDGTSQCKFGDGTYGSIPPAGAVTFTYVTLDTAANTATSIAVGSTGTPTGYTATCVTTTTATPNIDPPSPEFYKNVGPGQASNNGRAVTRDDYRAIALNYLDVIDARFLGQAELNPSDLRRMNVIGAVLLTSSAVAGTPWSQAQWLDFKKYMSSLGIATTYMIRIDPTPVIVNPSLTIAASTTASVSSLQTLANTVVTNYFTPSNTSLGYSLEPSDLPLAIAEQATYLQAPGESGSLIDYITPTGQVATPIIVNPTQYLTLGTATLSVSYTKRGINAASAGLITGL